MYRSTILILFGIAIFSPSSVSGVYSEKLWLLYFAVLAALYLLLIVRKNGIASSWACANSMGLVAVIIAATITSSLSDYRWGGLLGYLLLAILFAINLRDLNEEKYLRNIFIFTNVINIVLSALIVLGNSAVREFYVAHYTAYYPELVEFMTNAGKPVLTFGTHSLAAFFFYLFFWMNFERYKFSSDRIDIGLAICNLILCVVLFSISGLLFAGFGCVQVLTYSMREKPKITFAILGLAAIVMLANLGPILDQGSVLFNAAQGILSSPTNGLLGRFSDLGTLHSTVLFIKEHPFRPVGISYRGDLFFGDSGIAEYYLRGSIFLVFLVYIGLFNFLKHNLILRRHAIHLFVVIFLFEAGYTSLVSIRVLYFLPSIIVYLNSIGRNEVAVCP